MHTELVSEPGDPARPNEDFAAATLPASGQGGTLGGDGGDVVIRLHGTTLAHPAIPREPRLPGTGEAVYPS